MNKNRPKDSDQNEATQTRTKMAANRIRERQQKNEWRVGHWMTDLTIQNRKEGRIIT